MIRKIYTFQNSTSAIEDIPNPQTGVVEGRCFVIIDNDTGDVYRYPMPLDTAKAQGSRLMGMEGVAVADENGMRAVINDHERSQGKK